MALVTVLLHPERPGAGPVADEMVARLGEEGHQVHLLTLAPPDAVVDGSSSRPLASVDLAKSDLAVSLGGDGTFLRMVSLAAPHGVPVLGVNFGRVGYLLRTAPEQAIGVVRRFLQGKMTVEERLLLRVEASVPLGPCPGCTGVTPGPLLALNEVVLEKTVPGHMVQLTTLVDGQVLADYRADGVLVSTPTGSTAYNVSAGGPVLSPSLQAVVMTPVAAHLSSGASAVLAPEHELSIRVEQPWPAVMVVDGLAVGVASPETVVSCRVAEIPARLVMPERRDPGASLRPILAPHLRS